MKKQLLSRKRLTPLFYSLCLMFCVNVGWGQTPPSATDVATDGDYRTAKVSGNWSDADMWETRTAGIWAITATPPGATNTVYIQTGHTVAVTDPTVSCYSLHISTTGVLAIGANIVNVNGKIRCYTGAAITGAADGAYLGVDSALTVATMITTMSPGVLKFVGSTRTITFAAEWSQANTDSAGEFALDAAATGTLLTQFRATPLVFSGGIITNTFQMNSATTTGAITIKNGGKFISSRGSASNPVFGSGSAALCGPVTIETGGILELTGTSPSMNCNGFTNNGTVIFSKTTVNQNFIGPGAVVGANGNFSSYNNVIINVAATTKTLLANVTISGVLTLNAGTLITGAFNLTLGGTPVVVDGSTINASNALATVTFANSSPIVLPALPLFTGNVQNLTINGAGGVTLGSATSLAGKLTLTSGTLTTGGLLTLKSGDCCTSATVAQVTGGSVTGNVIVERNIPAGKRAYRLLSSPVTTAGTIQANWQEGGTGNPFPGFGTHITGTGTGFDATTNNASSLFSHNNAAPAWIAATNTDVTTLASGSPYLIYIRGSRLATNIDGSLTNDVTTLRGTGTLTTGTVNVTDMNATTNGFSLVGNPYQAQVNMGAVLAAATNLNTGFYYILEPKMGTKGTYVTVNSADGTNNSVGGSTANQYLQPGQACFVQTTADGAASLSFQETNKFDGVQTSVFRKANTFSRLSLALYDTVVLAQNGYPLDGLVVDFDSSESNSVNQNDADKLTNFDESMATSNSSKLLSIESRAIPTDTDEIPLNITKYRGTSYTIKAEGSGLTGSTPYLFDKYTSTTTEIPQDGSVNYAYTVDTNIPASIAADRFKLIYAKTLKTIDNAVAGFALYPNPSKSNSFSVAVPHSMGKASLSVSNLLGQQLYSQNDLQSGSTVKVTASNVKTSGVYLVSLTSEGKTTTTKWIVE